GGRGRGRESNLGRRALSSSDEDAPSLSTALLASNTIEHQGQSNQVSTPDSPAAEPTTIDVATGDSEPTAATPSITYRDWLPPLPGDWGGTVDPHGIKEPDVYGALFSFIIIAGLSVGVHQLIKLAEPRRPERPLMRLPQVVVAVASTPRTRGALRPSLPASTPEATAAAAAEEGKELQQNNSPEVTPNAAAEAPSAVGTVPAQPSREDASSSGAAGDAAAAAESVQREDPGSEAASGAVAARRSEEGGAAQPEVSGSEEASEEVSEAAGSRPQEQPQQEQDAPSVSAQQQPYQSAASAGIAAGSEQAPLGTTPSSARAGALGAAADRDMAGREPGERGGESSVSTAASDAAEPPTGMGAVVPAAPMPQLLPLPAPPEAVGRRSSSSAEAARQAAQPGPGPGSSAAAAAAGFTMPRMPSPFSGASFFGVGSATPAAAPVAAPALAPAAPSQVSLPSVRPEPLSRAPDSSALAHLPTDSSLGSLRERSQLALRAAASASEASQRAAAYAAAASSAASRAAEAAERAATAAAVAQAGLENATESAIVAAEARVAQAQEAAKEAEWRAASAAAHATAYQDMSQLQADIAERASTVAKPAPPGPLSQLQQLWRSASSAFTQAHN
ncbi:hypothetical protein Agub_g4770, partial [Astrephomene gubernaculifera]